VSRPVEVVVVTYNSAATIGPLLDSLPAAAGAHPLRTVVVDNGSSDATRELVAGRSDAELLAAPNDGYAAGLNRGVTVAGGSGPLLLLNPDCVLEPGCIAALVQALDETDAGIVVPVVLDPDGSVAHSLRRDPSLLRSLGFGESRWPLLSETVTEADAYRRRQQADWATGAVMLVDRACYRQLGGLDESFFMYSEETDLCFRAREQGWPTLFEPRARAMHIGGGSGSGSELYAIQALNRVRLYRRQHGPVASLAFYLLTLAREGLRGCAGDGHSRRAFQALVRPRTRSDLLPWSGSVLRHSTPSLPADRRPETP